MFDSLLGKKFTCKCKHAIKCIATRIAAIRRKKQAMLRFMRKDVADLIANGFDINAFGRIETLIAEINHASCYDIIQQYCEYITIQLPTLQKQRECPEEAMEAVATLIYAAARFSDLPELCDLRHLFTERYGSHMESSVNAEFVEKIQKKSFLMDKKLLLMKDIAKEFSVTWDLKAFELKMSNPPASVVDQSKKGTPICNQINGPRHTTSMTNRADTDIRNEEIPHKGKFEATTRSISQKHVQTEPRDIHVVSSISSGRTHDRADQDAKVIADESENVEPFIANAVVPPYIKIKDSQRRSQKDGAAVPPYNKIKDSKKGSQKDDQFKEGISHNRSPWVKEEQGLIGLAREVAGADRAASMVPPYTKQKGESKTDIHAEEHHENRYGYNKSPKAAESTVDPRGQERQPVRRPFNMVPPYVKPPPYYKPANDRPNDVEHKDHPKDETQGNEKPKPVSVRRRHMKLEAVGEIEYTDDTPSGRRRHGERQSFANYDDDYVERVRSRDRDPKDIDSAVGCDERVNRTPSGQKRHGSRRNNGTTYDGDCGEDDERIMDQLLVHYSNKGMDNEPGVTRTRARAPSGDKVHPEATKSVHPQRAASFPLEPTYPVEVFKGPARAASMQPEILSPGGRCVHPRLPDYDDLAARFAALKKT